MNTASSSGSGTLPSNTVSNPREDLKGITTRSGVAYKGPTIPTTFSSSPIVVECETEVTKDTEHPTNNESTKDVQSPVVQVETQVPNSKPVVCSVRSFLKTRRALIDVYKGELTLRVGKEAIPSPPLPLPSLPTHTSPTYAEAPLGYRAAMIRLRGASPSTHHPSEIPSPPLLLPSTTHRDDLPEADMLLQKRARFTAPVGRFKVGESSSAATDRQTGYTLAYRVDYGFIDTVNASIRAYESKAMTAVEEVSERVTDLATTHRQETYDLQRRYFRSMASSYEREATDARRACDHSKSRSQAMEAQIRALQRDVNLVRTAEAGPQDGPADAGSSC
ncbi:hypothetical protein Tco_0031499 [Tanacetum coccineum]